MADAHVSAVDDHVGEVSGYTGGAGRITFRLDGETHYDGVCVQGIASASRFGYSGDSHHYTLGPGDWGELTRWLQPW